MKRLDITASDGGEQGSNPFGNIKDFAIEIDGDDDADENDSDHDGGDSGGAEQQEGEEEAEEEQTFEQKYSTILCVIYGGFTPISRGRNTKGGDDFDEDLWSRMSIPDSAMHFLSRLHHMGDDRYKAGLESAKDTSIETVAEQDSTALNHIGIIFSQNEDGTKEPKRKKSRSSKGKAKAGSSKETQDPIRKCPPPTALYGAGGGSSSALPAPRPEGGGRSGARRYGGGGRF